MKIVYALLAILAAATGFTYYSFVENQNEIRAVNEALTAQIETVYTEIEQIRKKFGPTLEQKKGSDFDLYYNGSTGEIYPVFSERESPALRSCNWYFAGDHGSDFTYTTEENHFLTINTDPYIQLNKFLPPRVPISVTCVDWQDRVYQGGLDWEN